jgi:hypothetical protein
MPATTQGMNIALDLLDMVALEEAGAGGRGRFDGKKARRDSAGLL